MTAISPYGSGKATRQDRILILILLPMILHEYDTLCEEGSIIFRLSKILII